MEAAAVGSIQAASRRHLARRKVDEEMNWRMFNVLDEHEEQVRPRDHWHCAATLRVP